MTPPDVPRGPAAHNVGDNDAWPEPDESGSTADPQVGQRADPALLHHGPRPTGDGGRGARQARREQRQARFGAGLVGLLSSPTALAATVVVALGGLMLAFYVALAQINLTDCLADYNDQAAASTKARAEASGQDRALDLRERAVDAADRRLKSIDDEAINATLTQLTGPNADEALTSLVRQRKATQVQREANDRERADIASSRAVIELQRRSHPLPAPPSQQCH